MRHANRKPNRKQDGGMTIGIIVRRNANLAGYG
jgi:hypothetical protein